MDIGICTDANATEIEFFGNDYKRKIRKRDEASAFLCIEKNDVVLEVLSILFINFCHYNIQSYE